MLIIHSQTGIITNHKKVVPNWDNTLELINWRQIHKNLEQEITKFSIDKQAPFESIIDVIFFVN